MSVKKIRISIAVVVAILVIALGLFVLWTLNSENENQTENKVDNTSKITNIQPGPVGQNCEKNADCEGLCGNGECLIASCVKSGTNTTGECICLDTCSIEAF